MKVNPIFFLLFSMFLLTAGSCTKKEYSTRVLGSEPVLMSAETDDAGAVLIEWARNGYRGMNVIHAGAYAGLDPIPDENIAELQNLIKAKQWDALKDAVGKAGRSPIAGSNHLSAAVRLGIVKRVFWIIPYPLFESAGGGERTRQFLIDRGLVKDWNEAARFTAAGICLQGQVREAEIMVCAPDTMPLIREPVLLDLNTDFFPIFSRSRELTLLDGFKLTMDALFQRNYRVAAASMTASGTGEEHFDTASLYIGSQARAVFREPSIIRQETPPPLWKARDAGDVLLQKHEFRRAYDALQASIKEHGPDKGLRMLLSIAAVQRKKYDEALTTASALCRADKMYCSLLLYLARLVEEKNGPDKAKVFRERAQTS
jgi:hypothetical protein